MDPSVTVRQLFPPWPPTCWVITDGTPGMENQALGLAEAMHLDPVIKRLQTNRPLRELYIQLGIGRALMLRHANLKAPWPDLLIATGRTSVPASLHIKQMSAGKTFTVQIQRPVIGLNRFDCVIVPAHDRVNGDNVIRMLGALHRITPNLLGAHAAQWAPHFAHLPGPRIAVLLGGHNAAFSPLRRLSSYRLGLKEATDIGKALRNLARSRGASLLVTGSRRTDPAVMAEIRSILADCPAVIWDGSGDNPYYGMLGLADYFIVTCDSVNMICEACSTGRPVHLLQLPGHSRKIAAFQRDMIAAGHVRIFEGQLQDQPVKPLCDKDRVAALARKAYENFRR